MDYLDTPIPVSRAILEAHASIRSKMEIANRAVLEAVRAYIEFDDPTAANVFGADMELLQQLANTPKSKLTNLLMTGIPIFSVRIATPEFKSVLDNKEGEDAALMVLLKSFGEKLQITSL